MKRGQAAISVIFGLVIIIAFSFALYYNVMEKNKKIQYEKDKILAFNDAKEKVKEYTENCLKSTTESAMERLWFVNSDTLFSYINKHFPGCIDDFKAIKREGYDIRFGKYKPIIELTKDYMYVKLDFPVEISKFEQKAKISSFVYKMSGNFKEQAEKAKGPIVGPELSIGQKEEASFPKASNKKASRGIILKNKMPEGYKPLFKNIGMKIEELNEPRPARAYIIRINPEDPDIRFFVTPPGEPYQSTEYFRRKYGLQLAINGDGHVVGGTISDQATGFAASEGRIYKDFAPEHPTVYFSKDNKIQFFKKPKEIWNAISGFRTLVKKGKVNSKLIKGNANYKEFYDTQIRARTSMGYDEENNVLIIIIVIEGGKYRGLSIRELAELYVKEGATSAIDMDSGSSTSLAIEGKGVIAGGNRMVANHFGVYGKYTIETVS